MTNIHYHCYYFIVLRSFLLERKKEKEMMEKIQATVQEGKAKIEERFEKLTKEFIDGLEREKRLVEARYVSQ